ncbi:MAG TPA: alpha-L-arabinofuranosidase C-terminal domain-containing protein [Robiginitalea sp.]|nr:alpha-L-arabinofuranosidase C-terminal domain-containing protein [Robiginitalea sp.]
MTLRTKSALCLCLLLTAPGATARAQEAVLQVDASRIRSEVQPTMFGIFFEDINFAADGGLYAELVKNRSFEFTLPKTGWSEPHSSPYSLNRESGSSSAMKYGAESGNQTYLRVQIQKPEGYELINEGFRGIGVREGARYRLSLRAARGEGAIRAVVLNLVDSTGASLGGTRIALDAKDWKSYQSTLTAGQTEPRARLQLTFEGSGSVDLDMVSLFPEDTWKGRPNGLRKDLVQLLYDLQPGFLRFPGGCIVEGRTLARRYQWKKTVGPVADRTALINRWNTEFAHRPTPDYYQSFGLGFFEYFQLAEDLGAAPMPILGCGMACQFNTGELVPLDQLDPYIQDALDLIEFANGGPDTPWGRVRTEMGHPEPFGMKYLGIGNEQWGPEYAERLALFTRALRESHPEIEIVGSSGPFAAGDFFEFGWEKMKELGVDLVDEHYYMSADWFRQNAGRYDSYDRSGPKVFAGEYAAQSVRTTSPENRNNWECALSEAAFITGLERNADLVVMTSYAPLMAHADGWQWTPDLIWFNNLESYGTANYYVQKLFATNNGTHLLEISSEGRPLSGQQGLYASAELDRKSGQLIVKLVNTEDRARDLKLEVAGGKLGRKARLSILRGEAPGAVNSFEAPLAVSPVEEMMNLGGSEIRLSLSPASLTVLRADIR